MFQFTCYVDYSGIYSSPLTIGLSATPVHLVWDRTIHRFLYITLHYIATIPVSAAGVDVRIYFGRQMTPSYIFSLRDSVNDIWNKV